MLKVQRKWKTTLKKHQWIDCIEILNIHIYLLLDIQLVYAFGALIRCSVNLANVPIVDDSFSLKHCKYSALSISDLERSVITIKTTLASIFTTMANYKQYTTHHATYCLLCAAETLSFIAFTYLRHVISALNRSIKQCKSILFDYISVVVVYHCDYTINKKCVKWINVQLRFLLICIFDVILFAYRTEIQKRKKYWANFKWCVYSVLFVQNVIDNFYQLALN